MLKYNTSTLKKLEAIVREGGYVLRYEKGNFQSGYCILEHKKVVVINKYFSTEARVSNLLEMLESLDIDETGLSDASRKLYEQLKVKEIEF